MNVQYWRALSVYSVCLPLEVYDVNIVGWHEWVAMSWWNKTISLGHSLSLRLIKMATDSKWDLRRSQPNDQSKIDVGWADSGSITLKSVLSSSVYLILTLDFAITMTTNGTHWYAHVSTIRTHNIRTCTYRSFTWSRHPCVCVVRLCVCTNNCNN